MLTEKQVAAIEKKIGRALTPREIVEGQLARPRLTIREEHEIEIWKPKLANDSTPQTEQEKQLAAAEAAVVQAQAVADQEAYERKLASMSMAERNALAAIEWRDKLRGPSVEDPSAKQPKNVQAMLDKLEEHRLELAFDPSVSRAELVAVDQAISQWSTPGGCPNAASESLKKIDANSAAREEGRVNSLKAKAQELGVPVDIKPQVGKRFAESLKDSTAEISDPYQRAYVEAAEARKQIAADRAAFEAESANEQE